MKSIHIGAVLLVAVAVASGAATARAGGGPATGSSGYKLSGTLSAYVQATQKKPGSITITVAPSRVVTPGYTVTLQVPAAAKIYAPHKIKDGDPGVVELKSQSLEAPVVAVYDLR